MRDLSRVRKFRLATLIVSSVTCIALFQDCSGMSPSELAGSSPGGGGSQSNQSSSLNTGLPVDANGFTVFTATTGTGSCADGSYTGTCIYYVSNSTGSDTNNGLSVSTPVQTVDKGMSLLRAGYPDWLLLKRGDSWVYGGNDCVPGGQSATQPLVIGSYDASQPGVVDPDVAGARPLLNITTATGNALGLGSYGGQGCLAQDGGNFIAIVGIEFYAYDRDPANAGYVPSLNNDMSGFVFLNPVNWMLIEDNKLSFFSVDIVIEGGPSQNVYIRRNVITDAYDPVAHSQGLFLDSIQNEVLQDNLLDQNGWNPTLMAPVSATIAQGSPGVITWPSTPLFPNGAALYVSQSGGGLSTNTPYYVVNLSGKTFNLSTTQGGSAMAITSGAVSPQQFQWADDSANIFSRNLYNNYTNGPMTYAGNISTNSGSEGAQFRSGGWITDNLFARDSFGFTFGMDPGTDGPSVVSPVISTGVATYNVVMESNDIQSVPPDNPRGGGIWVGNTSGSGIQVEQNIVANVASSLVNQFGIDSDNYVSGDVVINNIVCNWNNPIQDQGTGDTMSPNVSNASSCSGLGLPNPNATIETYDSSVLGGPGTLADFVARARLQSKNNWNPALMAHAVNNYIRTGFGVSSPPSD